MTPKEQYHLMRQKFLAEIELNKGRQSESEEFLTLCTNVKVQDQRWRDTLYPFQGGLQDTRVSYHQRDAHRQIHCATVTVESCLAVLSKVCPSLYQYDNVPTPIYLI